MTLYINIKYKYKMKELYMLSIFFVNCGNKIFCTFRNERKVFCNDVSEEPVLPGKKRFN